MPARGVRCPHPGCPRKSRMMRDEGALSPLLLHILNRLPAVPLGRRDVNFPVTPRKTDRPPYGRCTSAGPMMCIRKVAAHHGACTTRHLTHRRPPQQPQRLLHAHVHPLRGRVQPPLAPLLLAHPHDQTVTPTTPAPQPQTQAPPRRPQTGAPAPGGTTPARHDTRRSVGLLSPSNLHRHSRRFLAVCNLPPRRLDGDQGHAMTICVGDGWAPNVLPGSRCEDAKASVPPSSSGLGPRPFTAVARVRIPLGVRLGLWWNGSSEIWLRAARGLVAQLVSAPPCHGGGRGFKSRRGRGRWCWPGQV